jgi:hypothetical protein
MQYTGRLSLEAVQREALIVLFQGLNTMINSMTSTWDTENAALMTALGRSNPNWTVEQIANENFYPGTIPSLINAPIDKYPNCAVDCFRGDPKTTSDDLGENYTHRLLVEIMVKSGTFDPSPTDLTGGILIEQECNSRINKTLDAAHLTLKENRHLNNTIPELPAPSVTTGDLFIRRAENGQGERWYWQGGTLEYNLDKYVDLV